MPNPQSLHRHRVGLSLALFLGVVALGVTSIAASEDESPRNNAPTVEATPTKPAADGSSKKDGATNMNPAKAKSEGAAAPKDVATTKPAVQTATFGVG